MSGGGDLYANGFAHLRDELGYLDLLLRRAVVIARAKFRPGEADEFRGMLISEAEIDRLMDHVSLAGVTHDTQALLDALEDEIAAHRAAAKARIAASRAAGVFLPLADLAARFALSEAETDLLLVALAPELATSYETIFAYLQNDATRKRPGVELALELICLSLEEKFLARRFLAGGTLVQARLLLLGEEAYDRQPTLLRRFIKLDAAVLAFLLEQKPVPTPRAKILFAADTVPELSAAEATGRALDALVQALRRAGTARAAILLAGPAGAPLEEAAIALGCALGRALLILDPAIALANAEAVTETLRDALLWDALLVFSMPAEPTAMAAFWERLSESGQAAIVLGEPDQLRALPAGLRLWRVAVAGPGFEARKSLWRIAAGEAVDAAGIERLADVFPFGAAQIRQTVALAQTEAALNGAAEPGLDGLLVAGRLLASPNLRRFATIIPARNGWDDLVLPDDRKDQLRSIAARVANRAVVQRDWGFGARQSRGGGLAVLFAGPPGTGKTMAAEVLAGALSLDLYQIDLSTVVSKYIGEAEKQLGAIFDEAEQGQCILFFDECDAIFGKRTEVKDAHDRYANTEVNYLLQRLEHYDGIVLLATNFQKNIDEAFLRRLQDSVDFPFPDEAAREKIWRRQFSAPAPADPALDYGLLAAQFKLAGGNIRNAALYAAYRAAETGGRDGVIRMPLVLEGIRREFQKQGKLVAAQDMPRPMPVRA